MKIVTKRKAIKMIREKISIMLAEKAKNDCDFDKYMAFDCVYDSLEVFYKLSILNKKELDSLWKEMQVITQ